MDRSQMSLVDPAWEYLDPTPDIFAMFQEFDKTFFGGTMDRVELKWSKRMTSCAGLMAPLEGRGGACSIRLSEPLLKLRPRKDLVQTLLHEMIHAHLHVTRNRESDPHGPKFKEHMHRINKIAGTNITVYHNFHDEVNLHKQHWWRCNGPCRNWKPYYGWVKRATNRAPAKNDFWWAQHQQTCGGQYIKVKEPEGYSKKKEAQAQKSLGKNGNLLSKIKKKYNVNRPVSTVTTPKIIDIWNKKPTNVTSPKTPLKTNNSSTLVQTKGPPFQTKGPLIQTKSPPFQTKGPPIQTKSPPFQTKGPPIQTKSPPFQTKVPSPNRENIKSSSNSFASGGGVTLGTNGNHFSMNNMLGQLHKENMERRRRQLSGKSDPSRIVQETKSKSQENHLKGKPVYVDLTESPPPSQPVPSKNNPNSSLIPKKPTSSLTKQVSPDSDQKSHSKVPQSSLGDFGKPLKDRILNGSKRSFLTNKVDFVEKNVERSFKSSDKLSKSHLSSPEKKNSSGFSPTSYLSSQHKKSVLSSSSTNSSPKSNNDHSLLTEKDTATALLLLKKKRRRLLSSSTDSSPNEQTKSEKKSWTISSNISSRLNPDFFSTSTYKEKKPLFRDSSSSKEKKSSPNNSLSSSNNSVEKNLLSGSDSFSPSNKERKPTINKSNTYGLSNERKLSMTDSSSSSSSPSNKDRKHSPMNSPSPTSVNKARKTIFTNTSPSHISKVHSSSSHVPIKRHCFPDSSSSHSPFKQKRVSHTEPSSTSKHLSSSSPEKKHSSTKLHSPQYSDKHKRKEDLTFATSPADKTFTSSFNQQTPEKMKKKAKLLEQLFGDDSDSEIEIETMSSQRLKYPNPSSSSSTFKSRNATKSPHKSTSGSSSKKSSSQQIQSNRLENYFSTPIKRPLPEDDLIIDDDMASSGRISQSQTSQTRVACPICQKKMPESTINGHLDECLNMNLIRDGT